VIKVENQRNGELYFQIWAQLAREYLPVKIWLFYVIIIMVKWNEM